MIITYIGEDVEKLEHSCHRWKCKVLQPLWKIVWWGFNKLDIILIYDLAIPVLGISSKELKQGLN